jgi:hypothetical protein
MTAKGLVNEVFNISWFFFGERKELYELRQEASKKEDLPNKVEYHTLQQSTL